MTPLMEHPLPFGLGTFSQADAEPFPGLVVGDRVLDLRPTLGPAATTRTLLEDWEASLATLAQLTDDVATKGIAISQLMPLAPVEPRQLLCAGANYYRHLREIAYSMRKNAGDERPDETIHAEADEMTRQRSETGAPFIFAGLVSAICGAQDDIVLWGPGHQHDWELELAVVIGRPARSIEPEDAMAHVAGYMIANDISTRDVMNRPGFSMTDFLMTKNRPTFFPLGPYLVPRGFVSDPDHLRIRLSVNGELMQDECVDDIIFGIDRLVSYASSVTQLFPGDILLTGSPAGNAGHHGNRWLAPGDVIDAEITGLGHQRNRCVAPPKTSHDS